MPIYEYECGNQQCQHRFEEIQRFSDAVLLDCPSCHQPTLLRLISPGTFHLKGEGWYLTESRTEAKKSPRAASAATLPDKPTELASAQAADKPTEVTKPSSQAADK